MTIVEYLVFFLILFIINENVGEITIMKQFWGIVIFLAILLAITGCSSTTTPQISVNNEVHIDFLPIFLFILLIVLYFVPTIIALSRHHVNSLAIFVVNFLTGWSFIGWVIAMVWSVKRRE
jgi:hypothetical protein